MPARAIWRGTISFGMVSIPVKLFTATESRDISFKQLHADDHSPIRQVKRCAADGQELSADEIVRGYEYGKDKFIVITDEDMESLPVPSKQTIELTAFVRGEEIDPLYFEKGYYIEPEEIGKKPFALLTRALTERKLLAIGKLAIRTKERLCAIRPRDGGMVLETLYFADEVREPENPAAKVEVSEAEMKIANALIDLLEEEFDPAKYQDSYREALMNVITAKLEGHEVVHAPAVAAAPPAVDLMAALRASVEAAQARKGGEPAKAEPPAAVAEDDDGEESEAEEPKKPARRKKAVTS